MAVAIQGSNSANILQINAEGTAQQTARPLYAGTNGHYAFAGVTGILPAALAANAVLFSLRWSHTSKLCVIRSVKTRFQVLTSFTAGTLTDFGFDASIGRTFTATYAGGTAVVTSGNQLKLRTSFASSQITSAADLRIATTAAFTGGTVTIDTNPFSSSVGKPMWLNPAAATEDPNITNPMIDWSANIADGDHPIVLATSEGIVIRNRAVWPAAGTGILSVEVKWSEVDSF
jgi:hypothetical protein